MLRLSLISVFLLGVLPHSAFARDRIIAFKKIRCYSSCLYKTGLKIIPACKFYPPGSTDLEDSCMVKCTELQKKPGTSGGCVDFPLENGKYPDQK